MELLSRVEIKPKGPIRCAVIWLHGLGADGHDFEPIARELGLTEKLGIHWIFPHAPVRPVTINGGMTMRAWYDIIDVGPGARQDGDGIRTSEAQVRDLIKHEGEAHGVSPSRIVLAGFSQGGAITAHTALRLDVKLAGFIMLSTYLPLHEDAAKERNDVNKSTPMFMAHGHYDMVLPHDLGRRSSALLREWGHDVTWRDYPMDHSVCPDEIVEIGTFLERVVSA